MSQETSKWLNENVLIGQTDKRGNVWHYRADLQTPVMLKNGEIVIGNHYSGFIPTEHVIERLFGFNAVKADLFADVNGMRVQIPGHSALIADDNGQILGVNGISHQPHQLKEWLLDNVAAILDDGLGITSAGLLKDRKQAWVEVSVPENFKAAGDFEFRPNLLAATSFDSSIATQYGRKIQATVCDNTLNVALSEQGQTFKVKHTAHSLDRIMDVREALNLVYSDADSFKAEVDELLNWKVNSKAWNLLIREVLPYDQPDQTKSSSTRNEKKAGDITQLYGHDERCAPWRGTALGVLQAFNTWDHHYRGVRGASRAERNMQNAISGAQAANDAYILDTLRNITDSVMA